MVLVISRMSLFMETSTVVLLALVATGDDDGELRPGVARMQKNNVTKFVRDRELQLLKK